MTTRKYILIATLVFASTALKSYGNALADGRVSAILGDNNWVQDNSNQNQANSREQNALDAQSQGKTGAGIATAAGISMIATGIPMILTLDPYLIAAGSQLISQGGMELAQGAANSEGASYNGNQRQTLNSSLPGLPSPVSAEQQQQVQETLNNPALDKMLNEAGVDPIQFKQQLVNGDFKTGNDVLGALGKGLDPEIMKEGEKIAGEKISNILGPVPKPSDENTATGDPSKSSLAYGGNLGSEKNHALSENAGGIVAEVMPAYANSKAIIKPQAVSPVQSAADPLNSFLQKMFGPNTMVDSQDQKAMLRQEALAMGVQLPGKGVSIFVIAHRKYNEFGKTRKRPAKVALR